MNHGEKKAADNKKTATTHGSAIIIGHWGPIDMRGICRSKHTQKYMIFQATNFSIDVPG